MTRSILIVLGLGLMAGAEAHPGLFEMALQMGLGLALFVAGLAPRRPTANEIARSWGER